MKYFLHLQKIAEQNITGKFTWHFFVGFQRQFMQIDYNPPGIVKMFDSNKLIVLVSFTVRGKMYYYNPHIFTGVDDISQLEYFLISNHDLHCYTKKVKRFGVWHHHTFNTNKKIKIKIEYFI